MNIGMWGASEGSEAANRARLTTLLGALLVVATVLLYIRVSHYEFLDFDDSQYVAKNVHVRTGFNLGNVAWAFTSFYAANWHPLTWLSHMADCQLFGLNSGAHHLVNLALHAANVFLLFWLLQRATGAAWRSFFVAALFAVHPLNVETVAWVAERKSLLSMLFSLLTIAAYGWYVRRPNWKKYLAVVGAFSLALMSKPMAVSLPLVLLLLDYWPLKRYEDLPFRRKWLRLSAEKLPLLLMSAASSAVTVAAQRSAIVDTASLPLSLRMGNAIVSYVTYIGKALWPARLAIFYPHPQQSLLWSDVIAAAVILAAITIAALYVRRARYLLVGWLLFVITLVPVIGIVQVGRQAMADHYAYIPCIGLFIIVTWGLSDLVAATAIPRIVPMAAALCLIVVFATATTRYLSYWQNGVKLFTHASMVAGQPDPAIEGALGDSLVIDGRYDEAYQHYAQACLLRPSDDVCRYNMAEILFHRHQLRDALEQYQIAQRLTHSQDMVLTCLLNSGEILLDLGDHKAAQVKFAAALQIDPTNSNALRLRERAIHQKSSESH
ncbi:MAG: tetratricopeptide repeat protein [Terriglobales bacterium]